ncbi:hypothetical protein P4637_17295 [Halalkalibacterium halodurans]|uniref:BH2966 protein n=1 Tax=Halalkalibacterium halodurans (strain ATCC BAA-125 / DSM 18197 / FERM 7344 / JCM 9153 / C-125) TaxID=272558 RepID=Q9K8N8_HALH5|nr:hypothetical protein [Halalkalibacterium halodurans]MED3648338.1 hypothetical protein [Halalkalibacterium halodurans]MED4080874.1 hypothetical protein [Halalkalibacterium halodurans]MED4086571.1 hypothetical protein [Halalkalibacterium halodurans]MED4106972.1 hypothetical protein [Halalkalibacterium halodurans]MED4110313.1 hypothetical protein [Halalkalibacterium halodurans]
MKQLIKKLFSHESIRGLIIGVGMMIFVFLFVHYILGIKAFK